MYLSAANIQMTISQIGLSSPTHSFHKYFLSVFHFLVYEMIEETTTNLCLSVACIPFGKAEFRQDEYILKTA